MLMTYFFLSIFPVSSAQDRIEQTSREMTESEGAQVILMCNYTTASTSPFLFWYKQLPNRSPTFILNQYTTEPDFTKKYSATLNSTPRTFPLMIKNLHVSDSAVYYCALRPTVTETHSTLIQKLRNTRYRGLTLPGPFEICMHRT
uniref:Ig-like domain-containing protein n=1 Tax=Sinocyclocheilus rhinocerous TaxID=307959 RepID=A0A673LWU2_9TELE